MKDDHRRAESGPAEEAARDVEQATRRAERRMAEIRDEVRDELERRDQAVKDRDAAGERPVPSKAGRDEA